jgi:hypothetical protein
MPKPKKHKITSPKPNETVPANRALDIEVESELDTGGGGGKKNGFLVRVFTRVGGIPLVTVSNVLEDNAGGGGAGTAKQKFSHVPVPGAHHVTAATWDRKAGNTPKDFSEIDVKKRPFKAS